MKITEERIFKSVVSNTKGRSTAATFIKHFGCRRCIWKGTICPHNLKKNEHHHNRICSNKVNYIKELYKIAGSKTKLFQMEELVKLKLVSDSMLDKWAETGELPDKFDKISKNLIALADKMRKQDEGVKIQADISLSVKDFRNIVDIQAKAVEGKDIVKEAEMIDKQDNTEGDRVPGQEI